MLKGKTKSGFSYVIPEARLNNYELLESIDELEENPLVLIRVVNMLLGNEQANRLKNHVRTEEDLVPSDKLSEEIMEIFQNQQKTKNF